MLTYNLVMIVSGKGRYVEHHHTLAASHQMQNEMRLSDQEESIGSVTHFLFVCIRMEMLGRQKLYSLAID